jgi:septal ring-binding cell division protein DamX
MRIGPTAAARVAVPTTAPVRVAAPAVPSPIPTKAAAATARPTAPKPTSAPIRAAAPTVPPSPKATGASTSRQTWLDRAERDRRRYVQEGKARFAIQLELACEVPSLVDAFQHDRGGSMWLLAAPYQGQTCFRVLWGRYASREEAARALSRAPAFFSTPRNQPLVVPLR